MVQGLAGAEYVGNKQCQGIGTEIGANGWFQGHQTEKDNIRGRIGSEAQQDDDEKMLHKLKMFFNILNFCGVRHQDLLPVSGSQHASGTEGMCFAVL